MGIMDAKIIGDTDEFLLVEPAKVKKGTQVHEAMEVLLGHDDSVRRVAYSFDGRLLACGGGWHPQAPGRLTVWDTSTASLLSSFKTAGGCVRGVAFSPDGEVIAYATGNTVRLVEMARLPKPTPRG